MSWPITIAVQVLTSALIATGLTVGFYSGGGEVAIYRTGWLGWLSKLPDKAAVWTRALILFVLMFLIGDVVTLIEPLAHRAFLYFMGTCGLQGTELAIGASVVIVGLLAYWGRSSMNSLYGISRANVFAESSGHTQICPDSGLDGADLSGANLFGARCVGTSFAHCKMSNTTLAYALVAGARFDNATLDGDLGNAIGVQRASFRNALLSQETTIPGRRVIGTMRVVA